MKGQGFSSCISAAQGIGRHAKSVQKQGRASARLSKVTKADVGSPACAFKRSGSKSNFKSKRSLAKSGRRSKRRGSGSAQELADDPRAHSDADLPECMSVDRLAERSVAGDNTPRGSSPMSEDSEERHVSCSDHFEANASSWSCYCCCACSQALNEESAPSSNMNLPCACFLPYHSSRIHLLKRSNDFIQASKSTWTKCHRLEEQVNHKEELDPELVREKNEKAFEELKKDPHFSKFLSRQEYQLDIDWNSKLAEGGQAEVYGATGWLPDEIKQAERNEMRRQNLTGNMKEKLKKSLEQNLVVKLFKGNFDPSAFLKRTTTSWMKETYQHRYVKNNGNSGGSFNLCWAVGAQLLKGRFAFLFPRHKCDLRQFIDQRMLKNYTTKQRPFELDHIVPILLKIARAMVWLHGLGFIHRDLKAANILCNYSEEGLQLYIADFESSVGIVGTGFWRAPEVLWMLKEKKRAEIEVDVMTQAVDVYSFAMTGYEVITGLVPLEGHPQSDYGYILNGRRPPLDDSFCPELNNLIRRCWHDKPSERPSFRDIVSDLEKMN